MRVHHIAASAALTCAALSPTVLSQTPQGVSKDEVRLGTHVDLSGPITFWGVPQRNGHLMAVEEINADGGVHGRKIKLIVEDNGYDPKKGVLATQKLLQQDRVFAMIGVLGTPVVLAQMPAVLEAGIPHMYPGSPSRTMYEPFHKLKFSLATPYDESTKAGVRHFATKGKKRVALIYQDDDFGKEIRDAAIAQAKASGMELVAEASYKRGDTVFSSQVARVRQGNPDLVVLGTVVRETVAVMAEAKKLGWRPDFMVTQAGCSQAVADLGRDNTEGLYALCQYVPFDFDNETPAVKAWMVRYEKRFNAKPDVAAAMTYDMQKLTALALENAGKEPTVDKFIKASENIRNWQNIFGSPPLTFGPDQRVGSKTAVLTQVRNGKFKRVTGALPLK
jgi:ABC-type branched-subunit amino acid transport system substrate-binding protein